MPRITNIQARKGTATDWSTQNPVLASGELGYDLTNKILKLGDGTSSWTGLDSINLSSSNITDFNSSVSGLLPVKDIVPGTNVTVTSSSGTYTINSTASGAATQILSYATTASFPATGSTSSYYFASDSSRLYQWTGSYYAEIGPPTAGVNNAQNAANLYLWNNFK